MLNRDNSDASFCSSTSYYHPNSTINSSYYEPMTNYENYSNTD
jgi:hypothetical protein